MQKHGAEEEKQINNIDNFLQSVIKELEDDDSSGEGNTPEVPDSPDGTTGQGDITRVTAPVIAIIGKQGNAEWYIDENTPVTVKIANIGKPAQKLKYFITNEEEQTIENTVDMPENGILSLTRPEEGIYVISAKVQDREGNWSEKSENASYGRDVTKPTVSLNVGTATDKTIPVTANATDNISRNSKL